ncbi:MAG: DUF5110 domain-containing protein [Oscillospiraceae bacterium]|nr:DUF5110 domain-containing protein [Oscillospiraceae bacterium]
MNYFKENYALELSPHVPTQNAMVFERVRVSVVTSRIVRVEYSKNRVFTDDATQIIWHRTSPQFADPQANIRKEGGRIVVDTCDIKFSCRASDGKLKSVYLKDTGRTVTDANEGNLKGTCRTLDGRMGAARLGNGLISRQGLTMMEDDSLLIDSFSHISPRKNKGTDLYYFAYGHDYRECLRDFYAMTGEIPFIPRYALSNWWSRYKAYTQDEYLSLMARFDEEEIPIAVATVDMDWHWVDLSRFPKEKYRIEDPKRRILSKINPYQKSGWTGYSWDTDLFPDWKGFLRTLQEQGRKVTLNLHPADGVRAFEEPYDGLAKAMGVTNGRQVSFDITDPKFVENYFKHLHQPYEDAGVDFWWIDWQQGTKTNIPGLDPLWALNHYHTLDNKRQPNRDQNSGVSKEENTDTRRAKASSKRPLIMSRYAGPGSHRYPLGFSGDTFITWAALRFQPYFTANAANIGYSWWSHDIGGHMHRSKDDELYLRWVQFGVFNPIMRLHSTSNEFMGKEPWKFRDDVCARTIDALRLRHRLLPYIYTENHRSHTQGIALCEPLYYCHPEDKPAYRYGNEYYFGSQLLAAPVTSQIDPKTTFAATRVWLPKGRWTDIFNGRIYEGGREITVCRGLESIPVFAPAGAIVPLSMDGKKNDWSNPAELEIWVWRGDNNYTLYEDDGESFDYKAGAYHETQFAVEEKGESLFFAIAPKSEKGDTGLVPLKRKYRLSFRDITGVKTITVKKNNNLADYTIIGGDTLAIDIENVAPTDSVSVILDGVSVLENAPTREALIEVISRFQSNVEKKKKDYTEFIDKPNPKKIPGDDRFHAAIKEILEL